VLSGGAKHTPFITYEVFTIMPKYLLLMLTTLFISSPAWANHHQAPQKHEQMATHSPDMIKTRLPMAKQRIAEMQMLAQRSVELMQHAQKLTAQAQQTQNIDTAIQAMESFLTGRELHQNNMQAMRNMHSHLQMHIAEHHTGKVVLDDVLYQQVQSSAQELGKFIDNHHAHCQKHQKPQNQTLRKQLMALGGTFFDQAYAKGDTQNLLKATRLLSIQPGK
jgi:hypothetical protein